MPSPLRPDQRRFPLHVHISVMFTFLLLLTGRGAGHFQLSANHPDHSFQQ